jgi:pimeloyl-ACP methyl ester carboxylesterase
MTNNPNQLSFPFSSFSNLQTSYDVEVKDEVDAEMFYGIKPPKGFRHISKMTGSGLHIIGIIKEDRSDDDLPIAGIPGFLQENAHLIPLMKEVTENAPIEFIGISPPSAGQSADFEKPMAEVTTEDYLNAERKFLKNLNKQCVLLGYSIGGLEAQILTAEDTRNQICGLIGIASAKNRNICRRLYSVVQRRQEEEQRLAEKENREPRDVRIYIPEIDMQRELNDLLNNDRSMSNFLLVNNKLIKATGSYVRQDSYAEERYGVDPDSVKVPVLVIAAEKDCGKTTSEYMPIDKKEVWELESDTEGRRTSIADVLGNDNLRTVIEGASHASILLKEDEVKLSAKKIIDHYPRFKEYQRLHS